MVKFFAPERIPAFNSSPMMVAVAIRFPVWAMAQHSSSDVFPTPFLLPTTKMSASLAITGAGISSTR